MSAISGEWCGAGHGVAAVLLAGGQARRMGGGDKGLLELGGRPLIAHAIERIASQVEAIVLNAHGDPGRFAGFDLPVVADSIAGHAGPLAGILAGMHWTRARHPQIRWMLSVPSDTPFLPRDLVLRLQQVREALDAPLACASSAGRTHPVVGLWDVTLADDLEHAMRDEQLRKIDLWTARYPLAIAEFPIDPVDPFFNANRPQDLDAARAMLARTD
ncbi:MAG: molybdenum cofactor guanylyltransferase MobA [Geminicoccaceae bacterium]|nr:molybdenum cofactor guanylyltransferase MobA [Geminicoccaceae bacterium]